jgi:vacuolar protein sorting-associated protein 26
LTPTFRDVNKKYSTRYYLSLVLIDEDARRYFKQSEIALYRQAPEIAPNAQIAQQQQIQQQMLLEQQRQQPALPPGSATAGPGREAAPPRQEPQPVPAPAA